MSVKNVKVEFIRKEGYKNLKDWVADKNNIYIGRRGVVFIDSERFPKQDSPFHNPFKINKYQNREKVISLYKNYIKTKLLEDPKLIKQLIAMKGKNLGCWCYPEPCHGDVLLELIDLYTKTPLNSLPIKTDKRLTNVTKKWKPYKYTIQDKQWKRDQSKIQKRSITEKEMCERHPNNVFTKGNNSLYPGCDKGWCCSPEIIPNQSTIPDQQPITYKPDIPPKQIEPKQSTKKSKKKFIIKKAIKDQKTDPIEDPSKLTLIKPSDLPSPPPLPTPPNFPKLLNIKYEEFCKILANTKLPQKEIDLRRKYVYTKLMESLSIDESFLTYERSKIDLFFKFIDKNQGDFFLLMLDLYDFSFFENRLKELLCLNQCDIKICWNNRCTTTAGLCRVVKKPMKQSDLTNPYSFISNIRIELSPKVLANAIINAKGKQLENSGVDCDNILLCLMITFEHELTHALFNCFCPEFHSTNFRAPGIWTGHTHASSSHGITFMSITNNLFGHTKFTHNLLEYSHRSIQIPTTNTKFNPYKDLRENYTVKVLDRGKIWLGRVIKSGGRSTKNAVILRLDDSRNYKVPYNLIISFSDLSGKEFNR